MINRLIRFSIENKFIVIVSVLALVVLGGYSLTRLPIDALPDITNNQVQVITLSPTLASPEVEQFITYPIETALLSTPDVIELRSISRFGLSVVTVVFDDAVDVYRARQMVGERLKEAEADIPEKFGKPELAPISTGLGEIYQYVIHPKPGYEKQYSATDLRVIQDWIVKRQLLGTRGVAEVNTLGGYLKEYEIAIDPNELKSMEVTILEVFEALERNNENTGGAYIEKNTSAYFIRGIGLLKTIRDIERIVVKNAGGIPILIRDIAEVQIGHANRFGAATRDGEGEVVTGTVMMLKGQNSSEVVARVKDRLKTIEKSLPEGVMIESFIDRANLVNHAVRTVTTNLIEGGLIVVFILVLFLGNLRAGFIVASVIPLSMLFAVCMMQVFGVSGNLMSLGAIDFGLIVDGAVIIVEAVVHRIWYRLRTTTELTGPQMDDEVLESSSRLMQSAAFGQIIIFVVYLPILALVGIEGKMFRPMALTVSFAILGALLLSLTWIPVISSIVLSKSKGHRRNISDRLMDLIQKLYDPAIRFSLRHRIKVISTGAGLLFVSVLLFMNMGGEFIPTLEEGDLAFNVRIMPGSSLTQTVKITTELEKILKEQFPEVRQVVSKIGAAEIPTDPMPLEQADMIIVLKEKDEWTSAETREELAEKMKKALSVIPGVGFEISQPVQLRFNELMTGVRSDIAIKIFGEEMEVLEALARQTVGIIQGTDGVGDLRAEEVKGLPQILVKYDYSKISLYGLNISDLNRVLKTAFAGESAGIVYEGERRFDLVVRFKKEFRNDIDHIRSTYISLPSGNQIPLEQVADITFEQGPIQVSREDGKRRMVIGLNVRNRDVKSVVEEIQMKLEKSLPLPPGYFITYGGQFENLIAANRRLAVAVPVALVMILALLFFAFGSFRDALLIFTAVPLAAIGGIWSLWVRQMPFSISAGVGFIALFGVAVLNGIVLISHFKDLAKEGVHDIHERVLKGAKARLRPVVMTAAVASFGFLPMAISTSAGAEVQRPLATVVIGGLLTSTLLTLVVLPALYVLFNKSDNQ